MCIRDSGTSLKDVIEQTGGFVQEPTKLIMGGPMMGMACLLYTSYPEGLAPVKIYVEDSYVRAVRGGTGFTKTGGNYAGSIRAQVVAHEKGYSQVLWLDGVEQKYIEEVGSMNIFFKINGEVVTPALNGSILLSLIHISRNESVPK